MTLEYLAHEVLCLGRERPFVPLQAVEHVLSEAVEQVVFDSDGIFMNQLVEHLAPAIRVFHGRIVYKLGAFLSGQFPVRIEHAHVKRVFRKSGGTLFA